MGVALGALGEKLLTKKEEENVFFRQRQSEYQFINPLLDFAPLEETRRGDLVFLRKKLEELINTAVKSNKASQMAIYFQEQIKRKDSKIVIIKIARKLLNRIRFVLINQQPYEFGIVK